VKDRSGEHPYFRVSPTRHSRARRPKWLVILLALISVGAISWFAIHYEGFETATDVIPEPPFTEIAQATTSTSVPTASPTIEFIQPTSEETKIPLSERESPLGTIIYAARGNGFSHIWFYIPGDPTPYQLTAGSYDDRDPEVDPSGSQIAFSSHRDGNWDLYLLQLDTGDVRRMSATMGYEGHPSWSPDGQWIAYEAYYEGNFDIWLMPVEGNGEPIRLTTNAAMDLSPEWSADGRRILFVSDRGGNFDLYQADLDAIEDRFTNLTNTPDIIEKDPAYSPDNQSIAYTSRENGVDQLMLMEWSNGEISTRQVGQGTFPIWAPNGETLAAIQQQAHQSYLVGYNPDQGSIPPLGLSIEGTISGVDWIPSENLLKETFSRVGPINLDSLYEIVIATPPFQGNRYALIDLANLSAPRPVLSDRVDEAFVSLRERVIREVGWDFLANLDYAFVGINDPLPPGFAYNDWLFTGRAFAVSEAIVKAGWVEVFREDIAGETYWRLFVRTRYQDGSMGEPLKGKPWDFNPRFEGIADAYDLGGVYKDKVPAGYYVDFTSLAADYGFDRQPALANWRTYYAGTRYSEFAFMGGLTWEEAMLELYPASVILTPTPFRTPTPTPTRTLRPTATPWWVQWQTPTSTLTPVPSPSNTPGP
jgi:TolB protein